MDTAAGARPANRVLVNGAIRLYAYEIKSGRKLWQKGYKKTVDRKSWERLPERGPQNKTPIGQMLPELVEEAVYDPEFTLALGRKRN